MLLKRYCGRNVGARNAGKELSTGTAAYMYASGAAVSPDAVTNSVCGVVGDSIIPAVEMLGIVSAYGTEAASALRRDRY